MNKKDKDLLLKDLCSRLPYGVKVLYWHPKSGGAERRIGELVNVDLRLNCAQLLFRIDEYYFESDNVDTSKPYLRPMSSMTEEEKGEVSKLGVCYDGAFHNDIYDVGISMEEAFTAISWLLERHFDINYLIEKGLALEAPEDMYKTE